MRETGKNRSPNGEKGMPQNTTDYYKKYLNVLDQQIEEIGTLTRSALNQKSQAVPD